MSKSAACMTCGNKALPGLANMMPVTANTYLCRDCIEAMLRCFRVRESPAEVTCKAPNTHIPTPSELVTALDCTVIGQAEAKRALAVAGWKHLQRIHGNTAVPPAHILMYGPTGCGKTQLAKSLAKLLDAPFVSVDATSITETGYKGRNVSDIVLDVLDATDGDAKRAKNAIVFVDEVDKLAATGGDARMAYQHGTQHAFLTMLEGAPVTAERRNSPITFNPSGLLFVFAGAFNGLEKTLLARMQPDTRHLIGFGGAYTSPAKPDAEKLLQSAIPADFVRYGLSAELMGRIPILAPVLPLSEDELIRILTDAEGSIVAQYRAFFTNLGLKFSLAPDVVTALAHTAHISGSGARGLKGKLEQIITDALFALPEDGEVLITAANLREEGERYERSP